MTGFLDVGEVADLARVSPDTIRRYCRDGRIVATQIGGVWVITVDAAEKFLAAYQPYDRLRRPRGPRPREITPHGPGAAVTPPTNGA